jgi:hypothetical protein
MTTGEIISPWQAKCRKTKSALLYARIFLGHDHSLGYADGLFQESGHKLPS